MKKKTLIAIGLLFVFALAFALPQAAAVVTDDNQAMARRGGSGGGRRNTAPTVTITSPEDLSTVSGTITITATATDAQDGTLIPTIYIDGVAVATATSYVWDTTTVADGTHTIDAKATDSGGLVGQDSVIVTVDNVEEPPPPPGQNKYAVIVGISDYLAVNDLSYCDEDATDWYNYLSGLGYTIKLFGDGTNYYPQWDGYATEYNIKNALADFIALADEDDILVYASSGHGTTYSGGETICCWDYGAGQDGEDGSFTDVEMADVFAPAVCNIFIFLDHCYSGGMNEVMYNSNSAKIYLTTTCTATGYGYDEPTYQNGAWTYWFLEAGLVGQGFTTMEDCFAWAVAQYPYGGADTPQEFDGNPSVPFTL